MRCQGPNCRNDFTPRRKDQRFCSRWCKRAEWSAAHPRLAEVGQIPSYWAYRCAQLWVLTALTLGAMSRPADFHAIAAASLLLSALAVTAVTSLKAIWMVSGWIVAPQTPQERPGAPSAPTRPTPLPKSS